MEYEGNVTAQIWRYRRTIAQLTRNHNPYTYVFIILFFSVKFTFILNLKSKTCQLQSIHINQFRESRRHASICEAYDVTIFYRHSKTCISQVMLLGLQSHKILFLRYCDAKVSCGNFTIIIFDILV